MIKKSNKQNVLNRLEFIISVFIVVGIGIVLFILFFHPPGNWVIRLMSPERFSTNYKGDSNIHWELNGSMDYQVDGQSGSMALEGESLGAMNQALRTEFSIADKFGDETKMTVYDSYWSQEKDRFYFSENDVWTGYQDAHVLYDDDWWQSQFDKFQYVEYVKKSEKQYSGLKLHKLSAVYEGDELYTLLEHLHIFSDSQIDISDAIGTMTLYADGLMFGIREIHFDLQSSGMTVLTGAESKVVTNMSFQIVRLAPYKAKVVLPKSLRKVNLISANTLVSKDDVMSNQIPEQTIISKDKKWKVGFLKHRIYDSPVVKDNTLKITSSNTVEGSPELVFGFGSSEDVYTDWCTNRDAALTYYNSLEGLTELSVSDVVQSSIGDYSCYWYAQQYTDLEYNFVHTEYHVAILLSGQTYLHLQLSSSVDRGVNETLSEDILQGLFDYVWIEEES